MEEIEMISWVQYLPSIITALGSIIIAWFTYNQYTKNKKTDLEIEVLKHKTIAENERRSDNCAVVYGELYDLKDKFGADRVYIVQPHPLGNEDMLSIYFEVHRNEIKEMKPRIQKKKISEVANFAKHMATSQFKIIKDIDEQVEDRYARSIMMSMGTKELIMIRLSDNKNDWVGTVFCDFTDEMRVDGKFAEQAMQKCATTIQYILPPIRD